MKPENWTDRHHGLTTTRTGIKIGAAYQPPPPGMGSEAERVQSALLARPVPVVQAVLNWLGVCK